MHTSDSVLEHNFFQHEADFERLLTAVQADPKLQMIGLKDLRFGDRAVRVNEGDLSALDEVGFSRETWLTFQKQLRALGINGGIVKSKAGVLFETDAESILNGDSSKGYEYSAATPQHLATTLDNYRISERDKAQGGGWLIYKHLKGHWYLFLFISGSETR